MTVVPSRGCLALESSIGDRLITGTRVPHLALASNLGYLRKEIVVFWTSQNVGVFSACLHRLQRHLTGDRPDKPDHLACDSSCNDDLRLAFGNQTAIPRAQTHLRLPRGIPDALR